jgi:phosphonoacetaldehyde hydrolase
MRTPSLRAKGPHRPTFRSRACHSPIRAVVFDVAGTVVDHGSRAPLLAMRQLFETYLHTTLPDARIRASMGKPKKEHIRDIYAGIIHHEFISPATIDACHRAFCKLMPETASSRNEWVAAQVPGVLEHLLAGGIRVGFCTGYDRATVSSFEQLLRSTFGSSHGMPVVTTDDVDRGRPHPDMALRVASLLEQHPLHCMKVGDTRVDMLEGAAAGMCCVGVVDTGNEIGLDAAQWEALSMEHKIALRKPAKRALVRAGATVTVRSVCDLSWLL